MLPIDYLPGARNDFDKSFDWYAERSTLAAERFANAVDAGLIRVAQRPLAFPFVDQIHQGCPLKKFPFRIIFRVIDDRILIVAVAHAKRRPSYWGQRR